MLKDLTFLQLMADSIKRLLHTNDYSSVRLNYQHACLFLYHLLCFRMKDKERVLIPRELPLQYYFHL